MKARAISILLAGITGAVFGAGLVISGMTQPAKVIGFLDPLHGWDPSLAFVMAGAAVVYGVFFRVIRTRGRPWLATMFHLPSRRDLDLSLIVGAALFGIGWGLGGLCPGPGLVAAASGSVAGIAFVAAMLAGMYAHRRATR